MFGNCGNNIQISAAVFVQAYKDEALEEKVSLLATFILQKLIDGRK
jgi:hypothetical protein